MRNAMRALATFVVLLLTLGVLLACWMPAYVGAGGRPPAHFRR